MRYKEGDLGRAGLFQDQTHSQGHVCMPQTHKAAHAARISTLFTGLGEGADRVCSACLTSLIVQKVHVRARPDS